MAENETPAQQAERLRNDADAYRKAGLPDSAARNDRIADRIERAGR